jgi:hypothetical protein
MNLRELYGRIAVNLCVHGIAHVRQLAPGQGTTRAHGTGFQGGCIDLQRRETQTSKST